MILMNRNLNSGNNKLINSNKNNKKINSNFSNNNHNKQINSLIIISIRYKKNKNNRSYLS